MQITLFNQMFFSYFKQYGTNFALNYNNLIIIFHLFFSVNSQSNFRLAVSFLRTCGTVYLAGYFFPDNVYK